MNERHGSVFVKFALTMLLSVLGCHHGRQSIERKAPATATVGFAANAVVPGRIVAPGIVEPWNGEVRLSAQESGWIAQILVTEGQVVQAGQLLARLDDDVQRQAITLASADVAEAAAQVAKLTYGATTEDRQQVKAEYEAALVRGALATTEGTRAARLHSQGAISKGEADRATSAAEAEAAAVRAAEARRNAVQKGARSEDRAVARARLEAARVRLRQAEVILARRQISAPIAGSILVNRFHAGEFFVVGTAPLFAMGDLSRFQVRLEVDEIDSPRITVSAPCVIYSDDGIKLADGKIFRIAPKMGRRGLISETPTERNDVRVREVFVEVPGAVPIVPGQRVWGHTSAPTSPSPARPGA